MKHNGKQIFEMPKAEIILFENEDVITTSNPNETPPMPYYAAMDDAEAEGLID